MSENFLGQKPKRSGAAQVNPLHDLVESIAAIFWKRRWIVIPPVILGTALGVFFAFYLLPQYRSSTLILIEPQQVPSEYVKSTDSTPVQARLNTLQQQIMSRTKLEKIITEYDPYRKILRKGWRGKVDRFFEKILKRLHLDKEESAVSTGRSLLNSSSRVKLEEVERMREDIKVKITGGRSRRAGSVAFSISFVGSSPQTIMEVTNAIAGLYIEENLKLREQYAEGTSDFLKTELDRAKNELTRQENEVKVFKENHMGTLPGQLQANLRTLDRLQLDAQAAQLEIKDLNEERGLITEQLAREEERKKAYEKQAESGGETGRTELEILRAQLKSLQSLYKENYPDVITAKHRIKELEAQEEINGSAALPLKSGSNNKFLQISENVIEGLLARKRSVNYRSAQLKGALKDLKKKVRKYERRVELTPKSEQLLADIVRDYEISRSNYEALLGKKLSANMAENMEKRQKGERFRVVDPANFPEKPIKPKKSVLIILGVVLGSLTSGVALFFLDFYKSVYRRAEDFYTDFHIPVFASIPVFKKKKSKKSESRQVVLNQIQGLDFMVIEQYCVLFTKIAGIAGKNGFGVFAVTSSVQGEGKTETASNLAHVIARQFKKNVILVDCDLRKSSPCSTSLMESKSRGLSDVIRGRADLDDVVVPVRGTSLSILPSRAKIKNSLQLLNSDAFTDLLSRLKKEYDYVILDTPPSLFLADSDIIAKKSDAVLYVVRAGVTPKNLVSKGVHSFDHKISGVILNGVDTVIQKKYFKEYV